jgi:hypothetical protein
VSDVLVTVRCRIHRRKTGILRDRPNGFRQYRTSNVGIHARNRKLLGPGDTTIWNFFEPSDYARDIEGWCQECGVEARVFSGLELLAAVEKRRRKTIFV